MFIATISGIIALGGLYHSIVGPESLEETSYGYAFSYSWQDRYRNENLDPISLSFKRLILMQNSYLYVGFGPNVI